jgi:hypothetical protein
LLSFQFQSEKYKLRPTSGIKVVQIFYILGLEAPTKKNFGIDLDQGWPTRGPRAIFGPQGLCKWPVKAFRLLKTEKLSYILAFN